MYVKNLPHILKQRRDEAQVKWLREIVSSIPEGRELLELLDARKIPIILTAENLLDSNTITGNFSVEYNWDTDTIKESITLKASMPENQMISNFLHELRHMWQHSHLGFTDAELLLPSDKLKFDRLVEGDARAFAAFATDKINRTLGTTFPINYNGSLSFKNIFKKICGITLSKSEIFNNVFKNYQKSRQHHKSYDKEALEKEPAGYMFKIKDTGKKTLIPITIETLFNNLSNLFSYDKDQTYLGAKDTADFLRKITKLLPYKTRKYSIIRSRELFKKQLESLNT